MKIVFFIIMTFILGIVVIAFPVFQGIEAATTKNNQDEIADGILSGRRCPCQCGNYLPGSSKKPACFGCSVGKSEITHVLEGLNAGKDADDVVLDLMSPILIEVFSDYTNKDISNVWNKVKRISMETHQTRVVLRTPGLTEEARMAVKLTECARENMEFNIVQERLLNHNGQWDRNNLINLAAQSSHDVKEIDACLNIIDIKAQIGKDRQHAAERQIQSYPTITVNRQIIADSENDIRKAIEKVILKESI